MAPATVRRLSLWLLGAVVLLVPTVALAATGAAHAAGEGNLVLPKLATLPPFHGISAQTLLYSGMGVCAAGLFFGFVTYWQLRDLPVHRAMREISELIYATCKTYLQSQGKFLLLLEAFIGVVIVLYFGVAEHYGVGQVVVILIASLVGIAGSYGVAWFGIRINTFANSRTAFASLEGKPFPVYAIPLKAGMSIGMVLISVELLLMLSILMFAPSTWAGYIFIGFAIGESLGAAALRVAGGIFTKIADIGADLMKIVFGIKEDDARNPGVIADCTGDNAGDSVGPTADGFETYGVTGVALIVFILSGAVAQKDVLPLLVWIFVMRIVMIIAAGISYFISETISRGRYADADKFDFEVPLTQLVWITSFVSVALTFVVTWWMLGPQGAIWWKLASIITCGTLAGAIIPEFVKVFTSTNSAHVREVVSSSEEGGASLNILSGLTAGNFAAFWLGGVIVTLMAVAYLISTYGLNDLMSAHVLSSAAGASTIPLAGLAAPVFAFGLVAFGFLGMGPITIAVDSYGPVTDNAQSVYELSLIEQVPDIEEELEKEFKVKPKFTEAKAFLEENDGAGNTFKATAKPVLIGTAVVGATTLIFSTVFLLMRTMGPAHVIQSLSLLHPPFLLGLVVGGAMIFWFTGASTQAVTTGAYRAVEFIKANIKLEGVERASIEDSKKVVAICTQYAQKGMFNIFLTVFFGTLAFAFANPFFFIGYLISLALFGLFQALFLANAGGAWDNAKKIVETDMKAKNTPLHEATVVGDTVGDPFKDTSSVAMNPIIKFTTLFGLLAVELSVTLSRGLSAGLAVACGLVALFFVWRSFYGMRIRRGQPATPAAAAVTAASAK